MFQFKHFQVQHEHSSMKVGTDAVLLGAWADLTEARRVLDAGCGCGVIALMAAQRLAGSSPTGTTPPRVVAIDLHAPSVAEARANVAASPWPHLVSVEQADLRSYLPSPQGQPFDCLLSNPPYFQEDLLPPEQARAAARHCSASLSFDELCRAATRLLTPQGSLQVIVPYTAARDFTTIAEYQGLHPVRRTDVITRADAGRMRPPKRTLLHLVRRQPGTPAPPLQHTVLPLLSAGPGTNCRSEEYTELCREFYLD